MNNEETIKQRNRGYAKKWYSKNREKLMERVECECGMIVTRGGLWDHKRRSRHKNNMMRIEFMKLRDICYPVMLETIETTETQ